MCPTGARVLPNTKFYHTSGERALGFEPQARVSPRSLDSRAFFQVTLTPSSAAARPIAKLLFQQVDQVAQRGQAVGQA